MAPTQDSRPQQVNSHNPLHQTIDGRVRKVAGGIAASSKKRARQSDVQHAVGKTLAEYDLGGSDSDTIVDASDKDTGDEESRGSLSPSESEIESDSESEDSDDHEDESDDEEEGTADANTD
jgi:hypothetical protein